MDTLRGETEVRLAGLVGEPAMTLRRLTRDKRTEVKQLLRSSVKDLSPELLLRAHLAVNSTPPPALLKPGVIRVALDIGDIQKSAKYLTRSLTESDASGWLKALEEEVQKGDRLTGRASVSRTVQAVSRWLKQVRHRESTLTESSTRELLQLLAALAERLGGRSTGDRASRWAATVLALAIEAADARRTIETLETLLQVVRRVQRTAGSALVEDALGDSASGSRIRALREWVVVTELPRLLAVGNVGTVEDILSDRLILRIDPEVLRERLFLLWKEFGQEWPTSSRRWVSERLGVSLEQEGGVELSDEGERLSLAALAQVLLTGWRASQRDSRGRELFEAVRQFAEQFEALYLGGQVGAESRFDPQVHEAPSGVSPGDRVRVLQPWVEYRGARGIRFLARAVVERA